MKITKLIKKLNQYIKKVILLLYFKQFLNDHLSILKKEDFYCLKFIIFNYCPYF